MSHTSNYPTGLRRTRRPLATRSARRPVVPADPLSGPAATCSALAPQDRRRQPTCPRRRFRRCRIAPPTPHNSPISSHTHSQARSAGRMYPAVADRAPDQVDHVCHRQERVDDLEERGQGLDGIRASGPGHLQCDQDQAHELADRPQQGTEAVVERDEHQGREHRDQRHQDRMRCRDPDPERQHQHGGDRLHDAEQVGGHRAAQVHPQRALPADQGGTGERRHHQEDRHCPDPEPDPQEQRGQALAEAVKPVQALDVRVHRGAGGVLEVVPLVVRVSGDLRAGVLQAVVQFVDAGGELVGAVFELRCLLGELPDAVVQLHRAVVQVLGTVAGLVELGGQRARTVVQPPRAGGQLPGGVLRAADPGGVGAHGRVQLPGTVRQLVGVRRQAAGPVGHLLRAVVQGVCVLERLLDRAVGMRDLADEGVRLVGEGVDPLVRLRGIGQVFVRLLPAVLEPVRQVACVVGPGVGGIGGLPGGRFDGTRPVVEPVQTVGQVVGGLRGVPGAVRDPGRRVLHLPGPVAGRGGIVGHVPGPVAQVAGPVRRLLELRAEVLRSALVGAGGGEVVDLRRVVADLVLQIGAAARRTVRGVGRSGGCVGDGGRVLGVLRERRGQGVHVLAGLGDVLAEAVGLVAGRRGPVGEGARVLREGVPGRCQVVQQVHDAMGGLRGVVDRLRCLPRSLVDVGLGQVQVIQTFRHVARGPIERGRAVGDLGGTVVQLVGTGGELPAAVGQGPGRAAELVAVGVQGGQPRAERVRSLGELPGAVAQFERTAEQLVEPGDQRARTIAQRVRAVLELSGRVLQGRGAVVQLVGPVAELRGGVHGIAHAVADRVEAYVDLVQVLPADSAAQRVGDRQADGLGEVPADVVDRVVRGDLDPGGGGVRGGIAEVRDVLGEALGDHHGRLVGAVLQTLLRLVLRGGHEGEGLVLGGVQQGVGEVLAGGELGVLRVAVLGLLLHRGTLVEVHDGGRHVVDVAGRVVEGPGEVAGVDDRDDRQSGGEQQCDRAQPFVGDQGQGTMTGAGRGGHGPRVRSPSGPVE
jgi:hypothetical protein